MAAIFDYTAYFSNPVETRFNRPYDSQDPTMRAALTKDQYREDFFLYMYFNEQHRDFRDEELEEGFNREELNTFLTKVCGLIDVDPAEAIAQEFTLYLPMVEWLRARYYQQAAQKFEEKLHEYYHWICETVYVQLTDSGQFAANDSTKSLIARGLQRHFRKIIDHTIWWNIEIDWILILTLIEGDEVETYERYMFFDDIALALNEEIPQA